MSVRDDHLKGSEARLWRLIEERTSAHADVATIDRRIWDLFGEDWAVLFTDLSGFSRRVAEFGIIHFLQIIHEQKRLLLPIVDRHDGILVKVEADSFLLLFRSAARAVSCAVEMQRATIAVNQRRRPEEQILLCAGIGYGRILRIGDSDVFGEEVNAASKLGEDTAKAGEILLTDGAREAAGELSGISYGATELTTGRGGPVFRVGY
jgi:adenylate cyclase